ncbi:DNA methyltransferase [Sphingomonas endophytica]|uniref:site-specific DNA-methyltransferase (adenine-specific) n=1 Tax=Sphingomonas endophytica TaxID=869719 RepID=A0A147HYP7_9SPHN|nr:DNA methyltransferase [Sphingomonas endophytica]KTT70109.1 DNA methylase [Sphingomonas endophytica]
MSTANRPANHLYYGDNLDVLRREIGDGTVDLIYLDPPFNSNANYNILFRSPTGDRADAQIEAFEDTWHWNDRAEDAFDQVARSGHTKAFDLLNAMRGFLGDNDMMAYLAMMAVRLVELHRVLKPTGSLYLHCDPTASHYLKLLLDGVFGANTYQAEIIWRRTNSRSTAGKWPRLHDVILHYAETTGATFHQQVTPGDVTKVPHTLITGPDGRKYNTFELTGAGITQSGESGTPWRGFDPGKMGRHWGYSLSQLEEWAAGNLIHFPANGGFPRRRAEDPFDPLNRRVTVGDVWSDIDRLNQTAKERLGYPTQKPLALLERIIAASSNEGDVVLDPFCGCGTAVHAAQKLHRQWIGIDVTHLAISLIEKRMQAAFPGVAFTVEGTPKDLASAEDLARRDKYQFQWWAVSMVDAMPYGGRKKGADGGIDGILYFKPDGRRTERALVSVKGGDHVGVPMIRDLHSAMVREKATAAVFVTKALPTKPMEKEAAAAGRFTAPATGKSYPRLQIITLAELFAGRRPDLPYIDPSAAFRRAPRENGARQGSLL